MGLRRREYISLQGREQHWASLKHMSIGDLKVQFWLLYSGLYFFFLTIQNCSILQILLFYIIFNAVLLYILTSFVSAMLCTESVRLSMFLIIVIFLPLARPPSPVLKNKINEASFHGVHPVGQTLVPLPEGVRHPGHVELLKLLGPGVPVAGLPVFVPRGSVSKEPRELEPAGEKVSEFEGGEGEEAVAEA